MKDEIQVLEQFNEKLRENEKHLENLLHRETKKTELLLKNLKDEKDKVNELAM